MSIQQPQFDLFPRTRDSEATVPSGTSSLIPLRPYQEDAIKATLAAYDEGFKRTLMVLPTGCLAAGTEIAVSRGGNIISMPIELVVRRFNGDDLGMRGRPWDRSIQTRVKYVEYGVVRLGELEEAWESGFKETFTLTTDGGRTIRATAGHPFLTEEGWVKLGALVPGDRVLVNRGRDEGAGPRAPEQVSSDRVASIERFGLEATYDLGMTDEPHNFLANGFVVHNSGKTVIAAALAGKMQERGCGRVLFIAHREELIFQTVEKMKMVLGRQIDIGVVKAEYNQPNADIVVASVQTIQQSKRLAQLGRFGFVIPDECHHATAESWLKVLTGVGVFEPDGPYVSGMTATPDRTDGAGLKVLFEKIAYETGIFSMIDQGYLVDIDAKEVLIDADFSRIRVTRGEFNAGDAGRVLMQSQAPRVIAAAMAEHAVGRQSIVFVPTVQMAHATSQALNEVGIVSLPLDASTPAEERRAVMSRMHDGSLRAVVNVGVLSEGTDIPSVDAIVMAQPTKSRSRYAQAIGRGLRTHIGKSNCLVLDLVGGLAKHRLQTVSTLFGIDPVRLQKNTVRKAKLLEEIELEAFTGKVVVRDVQELAGRTMHWATTSGGDYVLAVPPYLIMLRFAGETEWGEPNWEVWRSLGAEHPVRALTGLNLDYAQGAAEDMARRLQGTSTSALTKKDAPWRSEPVTQKQLNRMAWLRIPRDGIVTKGQAADAMNAAEAMTKMVGRS